MHTLYSHSHDWTLLYAHLAFTHEHTIARLGAAIGECVAELRVEAVGQVRRI